MPHRPGHPPLAPSWARVKVHLARLGRAWALDPDSQDVPSGTFSECGTPSLSRALGSPGLTSQPRRGRLGSLHHTEGLSCGAMQAQV